MQPNGIAFSPDEQTLYIADSGAGYSTISLPEGEVPPPLMYNATGPRTLYAYDVRETPGGKVGVNRRAIYLAQELVADGVKVGREGYVLVAAGRGSVLLFSFLFPGLYLPLCIEISFFWNPNPSPAIKAPLGRVHGVPAAFNTLLETGNVWQVALMMRVQGRRAHAHRLLHHAHRGGLHGQ